MDSLFVLAMLVVAAWWIYKEGKRTGSRKGFSAGRHHARRR